MSIRSGFHALFLQTSIYLNPALRHLTRQGSQTQHSTRPTGDRPLAATCVCEPSAGCVASLCLVTSLRRLWVLEAPELAALPPFTVRGLELGAAQGTPGVGRFGFDFAAGGRGRLLDCLRYTPGVTILHIPSSLAPPAQSANAPSRSEWNLWSWVSLRRLPICPTGNGKSPHAG